MVYMLFEKKFCVRKMLRRGSTLGQDPQTSALDYSSYATYYSYSRKHDNIAPYYSRDVTDHGF